MANDYTTTITLEGEDKTGAMWKSASKGAQEYIKHMEKVLQLNESQIRILQSQAKKQHRTYVDMLETINKNNDAYNKANKVGAYANTNAAAAADKHKGALKGVADELASMATRWISVGAAANAAKNAFVNYAEGERKLLVLQNKMKLTTEEIRNSEKALKDVARTTKTTFDESLDAATKLKGGLGVTLDQAIAKTTRLNIVAKGLAVIPQDLAEITTDIMRTMNIPANEFEQTMEMVAGLVTELGLDLHQLKGQSDQLGETAKMAGLKGRAGFAEMAVELGIANKEFGGTIKGARVLQSLMADLGSAKTGEFFNIPGPKWISEVEQFKKGGGNAVVYAIGKFKQLRTEEEKRHFLLKLGERDRLLFSSLVEKDNGQIGKQIELMQKLANGQRGVDGGKRVWESSAGAVDDLTTSIKLLSDEFGHLMEIMGVPQVISMITKEFERLGKMIQWVEQWSDWWNGKASRPAIIGPHGLKMPSMGDLATGMRQGLTGQGGSYDLEARKRLDENLKKGDATQVGPPAAKPMSYMGGGAGGIPPGYHRVSNTESGESEDSLLRRGAVWIAGKLYLPKDNRNTPSSGMGIRGSLPSNVHHASYGGSADSMYLPADYRSLAQRAGGGGGASAPITGGQGGGAAAGPAGPGVGTGYGPDGGALIGGGGSGGNQMPVTAGPANQTGGVPSAILAKAQEVAAAGGPGAVDQFMRSQGYPKAGAWCGQFAASVVKASGGTPPANPQVASNWRNFGTKVDTPQAGDIAVKVGSRFGGGRTATGATGSHVTVVSSVGKGTFAGLGGNQGGGRLTTSNFNQGAYEYFRGGAQGAASAAASPGGFAPQGGAPSGALNQDAYAQMFGGTKLSGQEEAIKAAAAKHNISPALLAGIIAHESGKGTSRFTNQLNNPAGIMDKNTNWMKGKQFGSIGEGIDASARTIAKNLARGGGTIEGMGRLYAPPGAANDPRGLNSGWAAGVRRYMGQLGGGALGGGGATDMSAQSRLAMTPEQIARGTPAGGDAAAAGKSEQLRRMGFVYDPDTGAPLRKFDPYTGSKLAAPTEGVAGSAAGGIHPGIAAERERRKEETSKDITREKQLRKEISDTQNAGIAGRKNKYGGEAAPQGGAPRLGYGGEAIRTRPRSGGGVGGEAAPMGGARRIGGRPLPRMSPRTKGVGGEAAPEGGMPEPPEIAQARRLRELQEINERRNARAEQSRTDEMNQRSREAGARIGRGPDTPPKSTVEEASETSSERAAGGPVTGGSPYLVGEKGPEMFTPNNSGYIHANSSYANINLRVNDAQVQFARTSMRRAADREVREARWSSYSDIGAA